MPQLDGSLYGTRSRFGIFPFFLAVIPKILEIECFCRRSCFFSSHQKDLIILSYGICAGQLYNLWTSSSTQKPFCTRNIRLREQPCWKISPFSKSCRRVNWNQLIPFCFHHQMLPFLWCVLNRFFVSLIFLHIRLY